MNLRQRYEKDFKKPNKSEEQGKSRNIPPQLFLIRMIRVIRVLFFVIHFAKNSKIWSREPNFETVRQ
ncbi:MAG: hypothetical protein ACI4AM_04680, partial [Muribaculaceae bacterium]